MDTYIAYATSEELAAVQALAKPLGKAWQAEVTIAMRGHRMFRTRYERLRALLEQATMALKSQRQNKE
jgi:hypothetical protein